MMVRKNQQSLTIGYAQNINKINFVKLLAPNFAQNLKLKLSTIATHLLNIEIKYFGF